MIFPAIDLMDGGCVRLHKGDFAQRTNYDVDPISVAKSYEDAGAKWIHIVDLDGAKHGSTTQSNLIIDIAKSTELKVQTGGGIRDLGQIKRLLDGGVERVVIGSRAITNPVMVKFWLSELGPERIVLALIIDVDIEGENNALWPKLAKPKFDHDGISNGKRANNNAVYAAIKQAFDLA